MLHCTGFNPCLYDPDVNISYLAQIQPNGCVECGSTNPGCNIDVHYVEIFSTHMKCEVKVQWVYGKGVFVSQIGGAVMAN